MNEAPNGRPVRFFTLAMAGWIVIRLVSPEGDLFSEVKESEAIEDHKRAPYSPARPKSRAGAAQKGDLSAWRIVAVYRPPSSPVGPYKLPNPVSPASGNAVATKAGLLPATASMQDAGNSVETTPPINPAPALPATSPSSASIDRWHGSAWLLWRNGSAPRADAVAGGRLGGSQAGVRIDYDLTPHASSRATAYARASTALNSPASPEGAVGIAWQPARTVPISVAAERRIALGKGGRNANAVMAVGGFGPAAIAPSLEAEAYAQGGMVGFRSRDLFFDGKISLLSPIPHSPLRIGASLSGGAQPQVERLDIGPEMQVRLPLKPVGARLSIEWRERIAGRAAPASGVAVTLGTDF